MLRSSVFRRLVAALLLGAATLARADLPDVYRAFGAEDCDGAGKAINEGLARNDAEAWFFAGFLYDATGCVADDPARAARYYQRAVELGYTDAANALGRLHGLGRGVPQDYATAERWFAAGRKADTVRTTASPEDARVAGYATTVAQLARLKIRYPQDAERGGIESTMEAVFDPATAQVTYRYVHTTTATGSNVARSTVFVDALNAAYAAAVAQAPRLEGAKSSVRYATPWRFGTAKGKQGETLVGLGAISIGATEPLP